VDNETGVSQNATLALTFDDYMAKGTGSITIKRYADNSNFEIIDEGALTDDAGNGYAGIANKDTWNFTT
jgi:hypothetical protein